MFFYRICWRKLIRLNKDEVINLNYNKISKDYRLSLNKKITNAIENYNVKKVNKYIL